VNTTAYSQVSIQLLKGGNKGSSPELYFKYKLQDTIFAKHEGLKIKNFASVKFDIDKHGTVSNVDFSISTDSLLEPYINDVLMSTNHQWVIKQNGKRIKTKMTIILPIIFTLRPRVIKKTSTRVDDVLEQPIESIEHEAIDLFQFYKKKYDTYFLYRNPVKYFGVVLNPIEVRVPYDPDANDY
jgi:hypothetical protein